MSQEKKQKRNMKMDSIIPDELQEQILLRLPLKSLLACIFMCKKWKTMICNENFKTRYILGSTTRPKFDPAPESLFRAICDRRHRYTVSAPIQGWICVKSSSKLRLYSPITGEILRLPLSPGRGYPNRCIFGYANGVFKVLGFFSSTFEVYSVRSGGEGSWRPVTCEHPHVYEPPRKYNVESVQPLTVTNALCKGGVLYYTAQTLPDLTPIIMSFDLNKEEFAVTPPPDGFIVDNCSTMVNFKGKVALVNNSAAELEATGGFGICVRDEESGQWVSERVEIRGWGRTGLSHFPFSFVGTIGSAASSVLVFTGVASWLAGSEYVFYCTPGEDISTRPTLPFTVQAANKDAYHYVRACLSHFECLLRA